ncbi:MAG: hypothetical protein RL701_7566 [Pseudomonadota bacterium]|jgi:hypothetical protein
MDSTNTATSITVVDGFAMTTEVGQDAAPRIRDLELGVELGYEKPISIRVLIRKLVKAGLLNDIVVIIAAKTTIQGITREEEEFWMTEEEAIFVTSQAKTDKARGITRRVIKAFIAMRESLVASVPVLAPEFVAMLAGVNGLSAALATTNAEVTRQAAITSQALANVDARIQRLEAGQRPSPAARAPDNRQTSFETPKPKALMTVRQRNFLRVLMAPADFETLTPELTVGEASQLIGRLVKSTKRKRSN